MDVPILEDTYEIDQFDTPTAVYLVLTGENGQHRASGFCVLTSHILRDLYPQLCDQPVPQDEFS